MKKLHTIFFTLKQHSPLIHFQHEQEGATLRASEVKSKLDRFIANGLKKVNLELYIKYKCIIDDIFIGLSNKKHISKYKLSLYAEVRQTIFLTSTKLKKQKAAFFQQNNIDYLENTPFFAEESKINELINNHGNTKEILSKTKLGVWFKETINGKPGITLQVSSADDSIFSLICEAIPYLFITHNFGTCQSKGFGSFTCLGNNIKAEPILKRYFDSSFKKSEYLNYRRLTSNYDSISNVKANMALMEIRNDYKLIKSGINLKNKDNQQIEYEKSQLFLYYDYLDIKWEKRLIKQTINRNKIKGIDLKYGLPPNTNWGTNNNWDDTSNYEYRFIRALLGLCESYEFQTETENNNKYLVNVKSLTDIERIGSPIFFKVIDGSIYLCANEFSSKQKELLFNKAFSFKYYLKTNPDVVKQIPNIHTPTDLDLLLFLDFSLLPTEEGDEPVVKNYKPL